MKRIYFVVMIVLGTYCLYVITYSWATKEPIAKPSVFIFILCILFVDGILWFIEMWMELKARKLRAPQAMIESSEAKRKRLREAMDEVAKLQESLCDELYGVYSEQAFNEEARS